MKCKECGKEMIYTDNGIDGDNPYVRIEECLCDCGMICLIDYYGESLEPNKIEWIKEVEEDKNQYAKEKHNRGGN